MSIPDIFDEKKNLAAAKNYVPKKGASVTILDSSMARHHLRIVRNKNTEPTQFTESLKVVSTLLFAASTQDLNEKPSKIETPNAPMTAYRLRDTVALAIVLRAALGFAEPWEKIFKQTQKVVPLIHVSMHRDEITKQPILDKPVPLSTYFKRAKHGLLYVLDPMNATGGSAIKTCDILKSQYPNAQMRLINLIGAVEGIDEFTQAHPDIPIWLAALDPYLNKHAYIVPGLGDAGDRQFGT